MRFSKLPFIATSVVLVFALALVGCDAAGTAESDPAVSGETGTLHVHLTDAPGDLLEAHVTITRVAIVPTEDSASGDAEDGGIEVLSEDSMSVDLLTLQNGVTEALGEIEIPAGDYSQIRLVTSKEASVYYEDANGEKQEAELKLPSASETGIKVNLPAFTIDEASDEVEITLDFNVEDSFVQRGQGMGSYLFKPVVHTESMSINGEEVSPEANS
ncbi:MAG: DUF4382 domain-containing protein [Bacteroidetes bacterium]|jgi:hypothetical protein|nr:DUF4382 domain-containing protein [Bacteroidota bacterium]